MSSTTHVNKDTSINVRVGIVENQDGWQNVMTGIGIKNLDKRANSEFYLGDRLDDTTLSDMYRGDGIAKKIVDIPAHDMVRNGFSIEGDTNNDVVKYTQSIGLPSALKDALRWARLFGGSVILIGADDGTPGDGNTILESPLREDSIKKISFFRVYDKRYVRWRSSDIDEDPMSTNYGKPKWYTIVPKLEGQATNYVRVHHSRIVKFYGEDLPMLERIEKLGWGDSTLQAPYIRIKGFAGALDATEAILDEFIVGVMTINNLQDLIAGGREKELITRLNQVDLSKHIMNTIMVDKEEDYKRLSATVNGIKDILEFLKDVLSAVSGIPQVKLFGEQSKGIGSTASGSIRLYYDDISDMQNEDLRPQLERIIKLILSSADFKSYSKVDLSTWSLKFNTLWQMTETEVATNRHLIAKADELYIKNGVLTTEEVAESRFGHESYSMETRLTESGNKQRKGAKLVDPTQAGKNGFGTNGGKPTEGKNINIPNPVSNKV